MDFFNTNWHANDLWNAFLNWYSIYTPLNLFLAKNLISESCLNSISPVTLRDCDLKSYFIFFLISYVMLFISILSIQIREKKFSYLTILLPVSFPILYDFERGNYIIITAIIISIAIQSKSIILKNILYGLAINTKFYLILPLTMLGKISEKILLIILTTIIFIIGTIIYGDENSYLFFRNLINFGSNINAVGQGWLSTKLTIHEFFGNTSIINLVGKIIGLIILSYTIITIIIIYKLRNKEVLDNNLYLCILLIGMGNVLNLAYYSYLLIIPLIVSLDINNKISIKSYIIFCLILFPLGIKSLYLIETKFVNSYLYSLMYEPTIVKKEIFVYINHITLPVLNFLMYISLIRDAKLRSSP